MMFVFIWGEFMGQIISLWAFSCNLYSQLRVKQSCLALQEEYDIGIPLLLCCCWAGRYYPPMSMDQLKQAQQLSRVWSAHCIQPLRHVRQQMKSTADELAQQESWQQLREQVKAVELSAEQHLLAALEDELGGARALLNKDSVTELDRVKHTLANIYHCFPTCFSEAKAIQLIATIVHAAHPEIQYDSVLESLVKYS
jgi:uncharacterized protein (TIGR02444 family)